MTEDYLIQEFHEAGIWLPEELETMRRERELRQQQERMFLDMMNTQHAQVFTVPANQFSNQQQGRGMFGQAVGTGSQQQSGGLGALFGGSVGFLFR